MNTYFLQDRKFYDQDNKSYSYLDLTSNNSSKEWIKKQDDAIDEYISELDLADPLVDDCYKLLDDYIVSRIYGRGNINVIDIGCGIGKDYAKYVRSFDSNEKLKEINFIGLDPLPVNIDTRKYPFICGRIEDLEGKLETKFDVFILASCLDHFENIQNAAQVIRKMANPNAICIVWIGLHDTEIIAEQMGYLKYPKLFQSLNIFNFTKNLISFSFESMRTFFYYRNRERKLKASIPLDPYHFHYFTRTSILKSLAHFGRVTHERKVPGSNSFFYTVELD
jgi:SAM-dependent methyltransferase